MLFNSYEFVLGFLPLVLVVVLGASALGHRLLAKIGLLVASLVFYAWWDPPYVLLLLGVLGFNFALGSWLSRTHGQPARSHARKAVLLFGLAANLGGLVYFKYTNFLVREIEHVFGTDVALAHIVLPLGISFIVFQKIAFLVDAYNGQIKDLRFLDYALFVTFFPQLISGPIVHHREVIPQFETETSLRYRPRVAAIAIAFLVIGAFKKVVIADHLSPQVAEAFHLAGSGAHHDLCSSWIGALAYTFQIYFDFSGYSDMAIGLGLLFGIRLPFNFNSPLKSRTVIEFWGRWHMTLTRFLTAYVYNPIVMRATRRRIVARKRISLDGVMLPGAFVKLLALPTLFTMLLAGAWHGAGFQFIAFGLLHGMYLVVNYAWRSFRRPVEADAPVARRQVWVGRTLTFLAVVLAIPFFRATSASAGIEFISSMLGWHGVATGHTHWDGSLLAVIALLLIAVQVLPNTQEVLGAELEAATAPLVKHAGEAASDPDLYRSFAWPRLSWRPTLPWAVAMAITAWVVMLLMAAPSEFLYFQF